jgi:hypothetical protein
MAMQIYGKTYTVQGAYSIAVFCLLSSSTYYAMCILSGTFIFHREPPFPSAIWSFCLFLLKMGGAHVYVALCTQCLRRFLVPEFLLRDDDSASFSGLLKAH